MSSLHLGRILRSLLAASAGGGLLAACGGAVEAPIDEDPSATDPTTSTPTRPSTTPPDAGLPVDAGRDASKQQPDAHIPDVNVSETTVITTCHSGQTDPSPLFCCADPRSPGCAPSPGGDACALDCITVCEKIAPGSSVNFRNCYWTGTGASAKIGYLCGSCGVGRVPGDTTPCDRGANVAERLAMQAYYEAASVVAFERLAASLEAAGAPRDLVASARTAAGDERRHAETFARLAGDRGACVSWPAHDEANPSLFDLALENASEGCVRETYGALLTLHQAQHAADPEVRAAFQQVARDEIEHAAFSWRLASWLSDRLTVDERIAVRSAHASARRALRPASGMDAVDLALGLPSGAAGAALYANLWVALPDDCMTHAMAA